MDSARRRAGADDQDRRPVRSHRALLGRRLPQLLARRQDDHRLRQRKGRRARQVQDRPGRRRQPVQGRSRDNEAERLLNAEKVDILAGVYSSAHAVPLADKIDRQKKFLWITTAISSKVFDGRNLQYTFRPQATGTQFGELSVEYVADYSQDRFKKAPKDLRL